ncbi:S1 family peptidase [Kitasatospora camelliae]|uniref:S1 family peptidase n=1 Tax=Kitasatospora camelliae TaxID=3156397 RepID=A0AAU8JU24_9ACTN
MTALRTGRRAALLAASVLTATALAVSVGTAGDAAASPTLPVPVIEPEQAQALAAGLEQDLGQDRTAGSYLDAAGRLVVTVTDRQAADQVKAAGAVARMVPHSGAQLTAATAELDRSAAVPGTAWAVDPVTNQVVLSTDSSVTGAGLEKVRMAAASLGAVVRVEPMLGRLTTKLAGGDAIYGSGYRCSLGFNVHQGSTQYFLTAGHCGAAVPTWYSDRGQTVKLGNTANARFPGDDFALVGYTNGSTPPSAVDLYNATTRSITGASTPAVGLSVSRSGSTTGVHSGKVTALNATVNYAEGTVRGLIKTSVCAEPGDSGGPLFSGNTAHGLTSGGSGDCTVGGTTYFQPVTEALAAYGVTVG